MSFAEDFETEALSAIYEEMAESGVVYTPPGGLLAAIDGIECIIEPATDEHQFEDSQILANDVLVALRNVNLTTIEVGGEFTYNGIQHVVKRRLAQTSPGETTWHCRPVRV